MKTAIVPAQVTTVEDRLAGNLTISQLLLMVAGLGFATLVYLVVRPKGHLAPVKDVFIATALLIFGGVSIRIRGKIVADWLIILTRFQLRPRRYVFTKNDLPTREIPVLKKELKPVNSAKAEPKKTNAPEALSISERVKAGILLDNPALMVRFVAAEKGGIDVSLTPLKH